MNQSSEIRDLWIMDWTDRHHMITILITKKKRMHVSHPHETRQYSLSTISGQVRSWTKSDCPERIECTGGSTCEVLHADVLLVGSVVPSVQESNEAETWDTLQTQNRQYVWYWRSWCLRNSDMKNSADLVSDLRVWEGNVGEGQLTWGNCFGGWSLLSSIDTGKRPRYRQ